MLNLALLNQRAWRLLRGRKTYRDLCDQQWILYPSEQMMSLPAIYLDGELDKVTAVMNETTYAFEEQRIHGGMREHAATLAYRLKDAQLYDGHIYKQAMKFPLVVGKASYVGSGQVEEISEAALACTYSGNRYFGHWMTDDLPLTLAAQKLAKPFRTAQTQTHHQTEYSELLDIHSTPTSKAHFKELILVEDFGQNSFKRERYQHIRSKLKGIAPLQSKKGVMFLRGSSGAQRFLLNENEVAHFLQKQGFTIIDPQQTPAKEIVLQAIGAKIIVGVEGSQLSHGLFTVEDGGAILALQPPYRFNNVYKDRTDCLGLRYGFLVGKEIDQGFEISLDDLARTLDKIHANL